ncbi:MAG: hypothetical protein OXG52_00895 [bacterium]|nr:hypothetical protein [bacterium]
MVVAPTPTGAAARRGGRGRPRRRVVLVAAGVLVLVIAVVGYLLTSDSFEESVPSVGALVAAVDISPGAVVSSADFTATDTDLGDVPHIPWSAEAAFLFEDRVAVGPIPAGLPVLDQMFRDRQSAPFGDEFEVVLELDLSATPTEIFEGDVVLLVDPGAAPSAEDVAVGDSRPPRVIDWLRLQNFDGSTTRLFVPPEDLPFWTQLPEILGATPQVLPVALGGDPEAMAARLNETWEADYTEALEAVLATEAALTAELVRPAVGPGELEVTVPLDLSLSPTPPTEGDLVLLVDPGLPATISDAGRPRRVLQTLELTNFDGASVRLFVPPEEWSYWNALPGDLGSAPLALPVDPTGNVDALAASLNAGWQTEYESALAAAAAEAAELDEQLAASRPAPGELAVDLEIDGSLSPQPLEEGDLVLLIDPGAEPTTTEAGRPRRVLQPLELTNFDGFAVRLFVPPDEWLRWRSLQSELVDDPMGLPVLPGSDITELADALNAGWQAEYETALTAVAAEADLLGEQLAASRPDPGELAVDVAIDGSLSPRGLVQGDLVLLVDPGVAPTTTDAGRPRRVLRPLELTSFEGGRARLFVPPDEWLQWRSLRLELGGDPLALPVLEGSDLDEMTAALNAGWQAAYEADLADLGPLPESRFWVSLPVTVVGSPLSLREGDVVFLVDPADPPNVMEWRRLEGWNGSSINFWATADRYAYYTFLQQRNAGRPIEALPVVSRELSDSELDDLLEELNDAYEEWAS